MPAHDEYPDGVIITIHKYGPDTARCSDCLVVDGTETCWNPERGFCPALLWTWQQRDIWHEQERWRQDPKWGTSVAHSA